MGIGRTAVAAIRALAGPLGLAWALSLAAPAAAQGKVTPLFADDAPLEIELAGPIDTIVRRAERSTDPYDATMSVNGETLAIQLAARGVSRRRSENCRFPPLSVVLKEKTAETSLFDKQRKLKLVTHCRTGAQFEQYLLKEYAAYRLYNVLTDKSFKVRLARIRYVDDGKLVDEKWGFLIEDVDDLARRIGGKKIEVDGIPDSALNRTDTARYTLFQYMIGNLDWDMTHGPDANDCCHNSKMVGPTAEARTDITPVAYDFDYSGLVDTPYAAPPESVPVRKVTQRYYRGLCRHNAETRIVAPEFAAARGALEAELGSIPGIEGRSVTGMKNFLADFFDEIATPAAIEKNLIKECRGGG
jgi:hypothetical protein